jgi:hypothetical protein
MGAVPTIYTLRGIHHDIGSVCRSAKIRIKIRDIFLTVPTQISGVDEGGTCGIQLCHKNICPIEINASINGFVGSIAKAAI